MQANTIEIITAIGAIATPILVLTLTGIGWFIGHRLEQRSEREQQLQEKALELEEKLRDYRTEVYYGILEPFILVFTKDEGLPKTKEYRGKSTSDVANEKILSLEYKELAFKLLLLGSDEVVRAFNDLMQFFYQERLDDPSLEVTKDLFTYFGKLLLEIRKSVGNEETELHFFETLEFLITDIRTKFQEHGAYPF